MATGGFLVSVETAGMRLTRVVSPNGIELLRVETPGLPSGGIEIPLERFRKVWPIFLAALPS